MAAPRNILMLAFPNAQLLDVTGPLQMFAAANDELSRAAYRIEIAAPERRAVRDILGRASGRRHVVCAGDEQAPGAHAHAARGRRRPGHAY